MNANSASILITGRAMASIKHDWKEKLKFK
jgi:hypothetical protein